MHMTYMQRNFELYHVVTAEQELYIHILKDVATIVILNLKTKMCTTHNIGLALLHLSMSAYLPIE